MLQYDRIDFSEGIASKWLFKWRFKYEANLCNDCHDSMKKVVSIDDAAIDFLEQNNYNIYFWYMSKDDALNRIKNS